MKIFPDSVSNKGRYDIQFITFCHTFNNRSDSIERNIRTAISYCLWNAQWNWIAHFMNSRNYSLRSNKPLSLKRETGRVHQHHPPEKWLSSRRDIRCKKPKKNNSLKLSPSMVAETYSIYRYIDIHYITVH